MHWGGGTLPKTVFWLILVATKVPNISMSANLHSSGTVYATLKPKNNKNKNEESKGTKKKEKKTKNKKNH